MALLKEHKLLEHRQILLGGEEVLVVTTFPVQGIHPATWWEKDQAEKTTHIALKLWVGMLAVLIILILLFQKS